MTPDEILALAPRVLTQAQRSRYFEEGYLLAEGLVGREALGRLRRAVEELHERALEPGQRTTDFEDEELPSGGKALRQILCAADYHDDIWRHASELPITDIAADVVGPDVKFRESNVSFKSPGGRGFDWHQDIVFFPCTNRTPMMLFTFLSDVTEDMGPTRVIPGSHRGEIYDHYDAAGHWLGLIGEHEKPRLSLDRAVSVTGPAGSVFITNCALLHAAERNTSDRARPMVIAGYSNADALHLIDIPYRSRYRWRIVSGEASGYVHNEPLRMKMPPDWPSYHGIRIDNLLQQ